ncbi:MAG: hypothetical protein LBO71_04670 [Prevotellaceae bacterium]|jgi:ABC-type transport system involved in Fe-S cluster assembly fused permease/ATPase subunit|nr:hypothetical protein [Prevotellaceae bacterium]
MDDCTDLEHTFSHAVPQLFAAIASILLIAHRMRTVANADKIVALYNGKIAEQGRARSSSTKTGCT